MTLLVTDDLKLELLDRIKKRSILNLIHESNHELVIGLGRLVPFSNGETLNPLGIDQLFLLLDGKVDITTKQNEKIETQIVGRTFEIEALIKNSDSWKHHWIARSDGFLLVWRKSDIFPILEKSESYAYLQRITESVELQKIKNDLRLIGLPQNTIQKLILNFNKNVELEEGLAIVRDGTVNTKWKNENGKVFDLKKFNISDYFIWSNSKNYLSESSTSINYWTLSAGDLKKIINDPTVENFLDSLGQKVQEIEASLVTDHEDQSEYDDQPEEEDDGLDLAVFDKKKGLPKGIKKGRPVHFLQHDQMDCGAACMSMISHYYKRQINIGTWRNLINVTREGSSMLSIKKAAESVGYQIIGIMSGLKALDKFRTPFIALMSYHYVVVYEINPNYILVADPAKGLVKLSREEFQKDFSQNALLIRPTKKLLSYPETVPSYKKYINLFSAHFFQLSEIVLLSILLFFMGMAPPLFNQYIFDNVLATQNMSALQQVGWTAVGLLVLLSISKYIRSRYLARITVALNLKLSSLFFRHILTLPFSYFSVRNVGDITSRVNELEKIREFFTDKLTETFINIMAVIFYCSILYIYHPLLAYSAFGFIVILYLILNPLFKKMIGLLQVLFYSMGKNQGTSFEQLNSLKTIQNLAGTIQARWRWLETYDDILSKKELLNQHQAKLMSINSAYQQVMTIVFLFLGVYLFKERELSIGQVVAVNTLASTLIGPILSLISNIDDFSNVKVSFEKVDEIITSKTEKFDQETSFPDHFKDIEFKDIWFQYGSDLSPWILKGINLTVKKGEKIALVGPSGSGKSTLAYMINLIYSPVKGEVKIGDISNDAINLVELRKNVSMILQDNTVFNGTILSNIAFGEDQPDLQKAIEAAQLAEAHSFISDLPLGYSTLIGEGQMNLSGGQKQRLSIARAIYKRPKVLIMDEATSALDSITEKKVINNLNTHLKETTCFIIAHRLNTIMEADRIIVIKNGKIIEEGKHSELMKAQNVYYGLFKKQINL